MLKKIIIQIILLFSFLIFNLSCFSKIEHEYDIVFVNGLIIDGTGKSAYRADIAIADGIIKKIGKITKQGKIVVDIEGKIISPGFIDTHSHHDEGMFKMSHMLAARTSPLHRSLFVMSCSMSHSVSCRHRFRDVGST